MKIPKFKQLNIFDCSCLCAVLSCVIWFLTMQNSKFKQLNSFTTFEINGKTNRSIDSVCTSLCVKITITIVASFCLHATFGSSSLIHNDYLPTPPDPITTCTWPNRFDECILQLTAIKNQNVTFLDSERVHSVDLTKIQEIGNLSTRVPYFKLWSLRSQPDLRIYNFNYMPIFKLRLNVSIAGFQSISYTQWFNKSLFRNWIQLSKYNHTFRSILYNLVHL